MFIGELVRVEDHQGAPIGWGHYGGNGPISVRTLGEPQPDESALIRKRILRDRGRKTLDSRTEYLCIPIVSSEADLLSGLVVEQLGKGLVIGLLGRISPVARAGPGNSYGTGSARWLLVTKDAARLEAYRPTLIEKGDEEAITQRRFAKTCLFPFVDPLGGQRRAVRDQRETTSDCAATPKFRLSWMRTPTGWFGAPCTPR